MGIKLEVAFPERVQDQIKTEIMAGRFQKIAGAVADIDAERATAWSKADEDKIKQVIRSTVTFDAINTVVRGSLRDGIATIFSDLLQTAAHETGRTKSELYGLSL